MAKQLSTTMTFGGRVAASFRRSNKTVQSQLERTGAIVKRLKDRQRDLNNRLAGARKASASLPQLQKRFKRVDSVAAKLAARQTELGNKIKKAAASGKSITELKKRYTDVRKSAKKLAKTQADLRKKIGQSKKAAKDVAKLEKAYKHAGKRVTKMSAHLDKLKRRQQLASRALGAGKMAIGGIGVAAAAAVAGVVALGVAVVGAGRAVAGMVDRSTEWSQNLTRMARRVGLTTTQMQALEGMGARLGFEAQDIGDAVADMSEKIAEGMRDPRSEVGQTFRRLGLDVATLQAQNPVEQLQALGEALARLPNEGLRLEAARLLGGDSSADVLLELTRDGGRGLRGAVDAARALGINEAQIGNMTRLRERINEARNNVSMLGRAFVAELAPSLIQAMNSSGLSMKDLTAGVRSFGRRVAGVINRASKWWKDHGAQIQRTASSIGRIVGAVERFVGAYNRMDEALGGGSELERQFEEANGPLAQITGQIEFVAFALNGWSQLFERIAMTTDRLKGRLVQLPATMDQLRTAAKSVWDTMKNKAREALDWIMVRARALASTISGLANSFTPPFLRGGSRPSTAPPLAAGALAGAAGSRNQTTNNNSNTQNTFNLNLSGVIGAGAAAAEATGETLLGALRRMQSGAAGG